MIGRTIAHYEVLSLLGSGGMGEVYLALDTKLGRRLALKLLPESLAGDSHRTRLFEKEARAAVHTRSTSSTLPPAKSDE